MHARCALIVAWLPECCPSCRVSPSVQSILASAVLHGVSTNAAGMVPLHMGHVGSLPCSLISTKWHHFCLEWKTASNDGAPRKFLRSAVCMSHLVGKMNGPPKAREPHPSESIMHLAVELPYRSLCLTTATIPKCYSSQGWCFMPLVPPDPHP